MTGIASKSFDTPDEARTPEKTRMEVVNLGGVKAARLTAQPGWRWSQHIKPVAGTETCEARHVGAVTSGSLHVRHNDGTEADLRPGDAYVIESGHDAWVTSDDPFVTYEFEATTAGTFAAAPTGTPTTTTTAAGS